MALKWKKVGRWDLTSQHQVLWAASGESLKYLIARSGSAEKPSWWLYSQKPGGEQEVWVISNRLSGCKREASFLEMVAESYG